MKKANSWNEKKKMLKKFFHIFIAAAAVAHKNDWNERKQKKKKEVEIEEKNFVVHFGF